MDICILLKWSACGDTTAAAIVQSQDKVSAQDNGNSDYLSPYVPNL